MSSHQMPPGDAESRLRALINDAVSDVEPTDRLDAIRAETGKVTGIRSRRPWFYGVAGAAVATAATITAVAVLGTPGSNSSGEPGPATSPSVGVLETPTPSPTESEEPETPGEDQTGPGSPVALPVYYLGDGPNGIVLFREFQQVRVPDPDKIADKLQGSLSAAVSAQPQDPDYRHVWPEGTTIDTVQDDDVSGETITVRLRSGSTPLRERPADVSAEEAELSVQQLVYTAQAAVGAGRNPVQILLDGNRTDMVLGMPTAEPLSHAKLTETLSLMNITTPREGARVSGTFTATGVNNNYEAHVGWEVLDADGAVVREGFDMAEGAYGERMWAWETEVDVTGLPPGEYTLLLSNGDPSGGAEGNGPHEDTRTIIVE